MFVRRFALVSVLALSVVRCADQPTAVKSPAAPQFLRWASSSTPAFSSTATRELRSGTMTLTPPVSLDQYAVSFWAVRGESRSVTINYRSSIDTATHPFLNLSITDPVFAPEIGEIAMGDSVLITVTVDTTEIGVRLEPTGLQFGAPAAMTIWYGGAGGDLNGDGVADTTDVTIESQLLELWYREYDSDPWTELSAQQSLADKSFRYDLAHFCWYAIAQWYLRDWQVSW